MEWFHVLLRRCPVDFWAADVFERFFEIDLGREWDHGVRFGSLVGLAYRILGISSSAHRPTNFIGSIR